MSFQLALYNLPLDKCVSGKIKDLVWDGYLSVITLKGLLENYVRSELFSGESLPAKTDRRFFPTHKTIRAHKDHALNTMR